MEPEERISKFLERYKQLTEEFEVDMASSPVLVPDGQGTFVITMQAQPVDLRQNGIKSPFIQDV